MQREKRLVILMRMLNMIGGTFAISVLMRWQLWAGKYFPLQTDLHYITLKTDLQTDRQSDRRTDRRSVNAPVCYLLIKYSQTCVIY